MEHVYKTTTGVKGMKPKSDMDARESIEHIEVAVRTPGGTWPTEGFFVVPAAQKIDLQLEHAKKSLNLTNKENWIAKADGVLLDTSGSYRENGLSGRIIIEYGPVSGG
jgi:hypothetical protein